MTFRLAIGDAVVAQIDEQVTFLLAQGAPVSVVNAWLGGLHDRLDQLRSYPRLGTVANWPSRIRGEEVRRFVYAEHVVFYRIIEARELVLVLSFRHARRMPWLEGEVEEGG